MVKKRILWPALLPVILSLAIILSACIGATQQTTENQQRNYPTVFITPLITQIIATRSAPTPTPELESTPTPTDTGGFDPFRANIYYPIRGCVGSRLKIGDAAFVAYNGGQMGLYVSKDINFSPVVRRVQPGEAFLITAGPWCENGTIVWKVRTTNEEDGIEESNGYVWEIDNYAPEGNGEQYWLLPLETNPGIPTPHPTQRNMSNAFTLHFPNKGCGHR